MSLINATEFVINKNIANPTFEMGKSNVDLSLRESYDQPVS